MDTAERFTQSTLQLWGGLLVWAAYFLVLYVTVALACERGFADAQVAGIGLLPFVAAAGLLAAWASTGALVVAAHRRAREQHARGARFANLLGWTLGLLGLIATAWTALPLLLLGTGCA